VSKPMTGLAPAGAWPWLPPGSARSAMTCWPATSATAGSAPLTQRPGRSLAGCKTQAGTWSPSNGLCGRAFANGVLTGDTTALFASGLDGGASGLPGTLQPAERRGQAWAA
jgi:hypothetical protein